MYTLLGVDVEEEGESFCKPHLPDVVTDLEVDEGGRGGVGGDGGGTAATKLAAVLGFGLCGPLAKKPLQPSHRIALNNHCCARHALRRLLRCVPPSVRVAAICTCCTRGFSSVYDLA